MRLQRFLPILLMSAWLWVISSAWATACPTCRQGLANDAAHDQLVQAYFWSIVFMMSMPFLIFGGLGTYFYWQVLKAREAMGTPRKERERISVS